MSRTFFQDFPEDDISVEYCYEDCMVCIFKSWQTSSERDCVLSNAQRETMETWIAEHKYWGDHDRS